MPSQMKTRTISREELAAMIRTPEPATADELDALRRLITVAKSDTGQSRRVADFLLAWWNAGSCGRFDLTDLWAVDTAIAVDMVSVFGLVARIHQYPDKIDPAFKADFAAIIRQWRPELLAGDSDND